jgi:hypothetical protein
MAHTDRADDRADEVAAPPHKAFTLPELEVVVPSALPPREGSSTPSTFCRVLSAFVIGPELVT